MAGTVTLWIVGSSILLILLQGVKAETCLTVMVENARYQPQLNARFHQSNYICATGERQLIYYTATPPPSPHASSSLHLISKPSASTIGAQLSAGIVLQPTMANDKDSHAIVVQDANNNNNRLDGVKESDDDVDYGADSRESVDMPEDSPNMLAQEEIIMKRHRQIDSSFTSELPYATTTELSKQSNYYLFYWEGSWRIGRRYCSASDVVALVSAQNRNPIDITEEWKEYDDIEQKWHESPRMTVICGTKFSNEEMYGVTIGISAFVCLVFLGMFLWKKRRSWERLEEEEDCDDDEQDPTFVRPEDLAHMFPGNSEPPSYDQIEQQQQQQQQQQDTEASVVAMDIPPPLYDDVIVSDGGSGAISSSPPPVYEASQEAPPAYTERVPREQRVSSGGTASTIPIIGAAALPSVSSGPHRSRNRHLRTVALEDDYTEAGDLGLANESIMRAGPLWMA